MAGEAHACGPLDPLAGYWGLSLFPQTSGALPDPSNPYNPDKDLLSIHNHLRSTVLQNPFKFVNEAKSIIDGDMNLLNSENPDNLASYEENETFQGNAQDNNRERRPGLARKRARFSLKPNSSQPAGVLEQNLDIDELKDPVQFFTAFERIDNAKREIQKQMGGFSFDLHQHRATSRQRRPGILGKNQRRPAKYKHLYSLEASTGHEIVSSQETFELSSLSPVDQLSQGTGACIVSQEEELDNSSAVGETKLDEILGELLHHNFEDTEEDRAVNLLQEKLQVKPITLDKFSFPDLPDNRMFNVKSFGRDVSKPRKALANIDNTSNGMGRELVMKPNLNCGNSLDNIASPTPPRSPFAPLSLLQKRKSMSKSADPFSAFDIDHMSSGNSSKAHKLKNESDITDLSILFATNDGLANQNIDSVERAGGEFLETSENSVERNISQPEAFINIDPATSNVNVKNDGACDRDDQLSNGYDGVCDQSKKGHASDEKCDKLQDEAVPDAGVSADICGLDPSLGEPLVPSRADQIEAHTMDECRNPRDRAPEQHVEETGKVSEIAVDGQSKPKLLPRGKQRKEELSRKQSLAGAGTCWKAGVRRSTRMRTRPLEYWKGEKLVYGRIHSSLPTVIGMKYASPAKKGGEPALKVKSFVSDEYKELLERASYY